MKIEISQINNRQTIDLAFEGVIKYSYDRRAWNLLTNEQKIHFIDMVIPDEA